MGDIIVTGPPTARQTGPRLRSPGPSTTRPPRHSFPPRSPHSHPFALPDPSRCSKTCGLPWAILLLQVPPHPNKRDHGCGGGHELPIQTLLSKGTVFKEGPIRLLFNVFHQSYFFLFSTYHYLRRRLRRLINPFPFLKVIRRQQQPSRTYTNRGRFGKVSACSPALGAEEANIVCSSHAQP